MNISPVSFASTAASGSGLNFNERINKPQVYAQKETPAAASGLGKAEKSKKSPVKKIAGAVIVLAAAAAGLAYAAKSGKLEYGQNATLNRIKEPLKKAGDTIYKGYAKVKGSISQKIEKLKETATK